MAKRQWMEAGDAIEAARTYFPSFLRSREQALKLRAWENGNQYGYSDELYDDDPAYGRPYSPNRQGETREYENIRSLSPNAVGGLIVATLAQTAYVEGISRPGVQGQLPVWSTFQRNRWLSRQSAVHRAAIAQGVSYGVVMPGIDPLTGTSMSKMFGKSAVNMAAFYNQDDDEWATLAIEGHKIYEDNGLGRFEKGWYVRLYDDYVVHYLTCDSDGAQADQWKYISFEEHGMPVPPIARCANRLDLEGNARGEIEPILPILRRIDQDLFDRLIGQRFGAWQVRYISGMAKPTKKSEEAAQAIKLRIEDLLVSDNKDTKFGTLPAGPLSPMIEATDADLRILSAISQTPPHHLLGLSSNLQAEALAAATEGLMRKSFDFKNNAGEFHEQMARLASMADGDQETAAAWDLRVRWRDVESGSLSQAADALGKLASQLQVPIEMLWERVPGWTDDDVQRAKEMVEQGSFEKLLEQLIGQDNQQSAQQDGNLAQ